jgi:MSHA biogenesis protein MshP
MPVQRGFAAIAAIFLVVILAALGAYMLTFSNTQQFTATQDVQGSRAYWAARAGLEWGIGSVAASGASPPACPASTTTLATTFDGGFTVVVTCGHSDYSEASATPNRFIYQIPSIATSAGAVGSINYTQRSLTATMER